MPVQELSFSFLGHFARWSKKKERMLVVDRPAEVLNFEQKLAAGNGDVLYFYAIIYLD